MPVIRDANFFDLDELAAIWFDGWQDAHAGLLPDEMRRARTLNSFRERLDSNLTKVRVASDDSALAGFSLIEGDELNQFYVTSRARGSDVAPKLMSDGQAIFRRDGVGVAWLACAIGNFRAARFYEKQGWRCSGIMSAKLPIGDSLFELDVWRYELVVGQRVARVQ